MALLDVAVPHFDFPFTFLTASGAVQANVVEQDTIEDIQNCVAVALLTRVGERVTDPDFGVSDPTFELEPVDKTTLIAEAERNEPRARIVMAEAPDRFDPMIERIQAFISLREDISA